MESEAGLRAELREVLTGLLTKLNDEAALIDDSCRERYAIEASLTGIAKLWLWLSTFDNFQH
jgi:hypothetical protein